MARGGIAIKFSKLVFILFILLFSCTHSDKDENLIYTFEGKVWIGKTQIDFSVLGETRRHPGHRRIVYDAATSKLWIVVEDETDMNTNYGNPDDPFDILNGMPFPNTIYVYEITSGFVDTEKYITISLNDKINRVFRIFDNKLLVFHDRFIGCDVYDLEIGKSSYIDFVEILGERGDDYFWYVFGFSWDKMIFMVVEKNEDETYTKFKGTYAISANEFSKEKLPDNIDWLDYLPLTDEFIGFNDQQNIVIYNPVAKTIRDTGAHPKRKMDGTPWASDFYYLEDDSLYFSQHVFHISRLVPWPFPEIYQFRKWYRLDFKTNKVQRIYQPDQFVRIIGRVK